MCFTSCKVLISELKDFGDSSNRQEQPPEVFFTKSCSSKFRNIHRKTLALESLFNKVVGLGLQLY